MKKNKTYLIAGITIIAILVTFMAILVFHTNKEIKDRNVDNNPFLSLNNLKTEAEVISKKTFENEFLNGSEIFEWMMKNDYFQEKNGDMVHPRFLNPDQKENLKMKYSSEYEKIIDIFNKANSSRREFIIKSSEISRQMVQKAVEAIKRKDTKEAVADCKIAIDLFPINSQPYELLTKMYLMTGQETKLLDTISLSGSSYPDFDKILEIVDDEDLSKIPLNENSEKVFLANFPENKKMAISFLFDDGEKNVYTDAVPIFEKYGYRATIPVVAGLVAESDNDPNWGSWNDWKDASKRGFEIANHSMFHRDSKNLHGSDFDVSIDQAKDLIEKKVGKKVTAYVFPNDSYTDEAVNRALIGHRAVRSWELLRLKYEKAVSITYGGPNFSEVTANRLIDIGIARRLWIVANCHGVTTKHGIISFKAITPTILQNHVAYIHSKSNDVWVDTFTNIVDYLDLRLQTSIEVKAHTDNSTDLILHSKSSGNKISPPLTVVIRTQEGAKVKLVKTENGQTIKAWSCDTDKICIDAETYENNIHVVWVN